jgi:hypothetical protein
VLEGLIEDNVAIYRDDDLYAEREAQEHKERTLLQATSRNWGRLATIVEGMIA